MALEWVSTFLTALSFSPNVSAAARAAGVTRQAAYLHRQADPEFAAAWDDAVDQSTDELVGEMYRRAKDGVREPVFFMGDVCGHKQKYSDTLAIFLAKAHRPDVYGDKVTQEHAGEIRVIVDYADLPSHAAEAAPGAAEDS